MASGTCSDGTPQRSIVISRNADTSGSSDSASPASAAPRGNDGARSGADGGQHSIDVREDPLLRELRRGLGGGIRETPAQPRIGGQLPDRARQCLDITDPV